MQTPGSKYKRQPPHVLGDGVRKGLTLMQPRCRGRGRRWPAATALSWSFDSKNYAASLEMPSSRVRMAPGGALQGRVCVWEPKPPFWEHAETLTAGLQWVPLQRHFQPPGIPCTHCKAHTESPGPLGEALNTPTCRRGGQAAGSLRVLCKATDPQDRA